MFTRQATRLHVLRTLVRLATLAFMTYLAYVVYTEVATYGGNPLNWRWLNETEIGIFAIAGVAALLEDIWKLYTRATGKGRKKS